MPTYISLCRWTQQGAQKIKEAPARLDAGRKAFQADGVKILQFFMTMGEYDFVIITEAPNDEVLAKAALSLMSQGNVTSQTSRAFTESEYRSVIASL